MVPCRAPADLEEQSRNSPRTRVAASGCPGLHRRAGSGPSAQARHRDLDAKPKDLFRDTLVLDASRLPGTPGGYSLSFGAKRAEVRVHAQQYRCRDTANPDPAAGKPSERRWLGNDSARLAKVH